MRDACVCKICGQFVVQEYDNEAEQAVCDVAMHYTDTPLDIGKRSFVVCVVCGVDLGFVLH